MLFTSLLAFSLLALLVDSLDDLSNDAGVRELFRIC